MNESTEVQALMAKLDQLKKRILAAEEKRRILGHEHNAIHKKLVACRERERLAGAIGQPVKVTAEGRCQGKTGTLKVLNRTRASVDIDGEDWAIPFNCLREVYVPINELLRQNACEGRTPPVKG